MRVALISASLSLMAATAAAQAVDLHLTLGRLSYRGGYIIQVVSVTNTRSQTLDRVKFECGFFREDVLIAADSTSIYDLQPGDTGFKEMLARSDAPADRAQCRIVEIR